MLSVASLLNPIKSEQPGAPRLPPSPASTLCTTASSYNSPQLSTQSSCTPRLLPLVKKQKMTKDGAVFAKGKAKGEVNYPPFERFDNDTIREIQRFQVFPLGKITEYCRHIPYNSEKKSFLEKTGRESFEVFQYIFKVPEDDKEYTVMWDYNVGLVRITPFFKCLKYTKTTPAKMLNVNPGLKNITHSITGGALAAQGYWMPYSCALAVCATFCHDISPALIPLFGPSFPSLCVPPEAPEYNRWTIDPALITAATAQAETYRSQSQPKSTPSSSLSPSPARTKLPTNRYLGMGVKRAYEDTDTEGSETSDAYYCSPGPSFAATNTSHSIAQNQEQNLAAHGLNSAYHIGAPIPGQNMGGPNPWLSAIPRSIGLPMPLSLDTKEVGPSQRRACPPASLLSHSRLRSQAQLPVVAAQDDEYDGGDSASVSMSMSLSPTDENEASKRKESSEDRDVVMDDGIGGTEKRAAWLLMNLSVRDGESTIVGNEGERPRVKRLRATSF